MALLAGVGIARALAVPRRPGLLLASDMFLTCGMTAVGLSVSFTDMCRIGWRPLAARWRTS